MAVLLRTKEGIQCINILSAKGHSLASQLQLWASAEAATLCPRLGNGGRDAAVIALKVQSPLVQ